MGGRGSGGARVGAGRKSKDRHLRSIDGGASHRALPFAEPVIAAVEPVPVPTDLLEAEAAVWAANAPHALTQRTLTPATAESFRELCEVVVRMRRLWTQIDGDGLTFVHVYVDDAGIEHRALKKHPLLPDYRGLVQRVEAARARFRLAPMGKELYATEAPKVNPLDRFTKSRA